MRVGHGAVELADIDGGVGAVGLAVVDGHPERSPGAELEIIDLFAHVEAQVVGQEPHLHPRLPTVVLVPFTVDVTVHVKGVDIAVSGERGLVLVVQHDLGLGHRAQAKGRQAGDEDR